MKRHIYIILTSILVTFTFTSLLFATSYKKKDSSLDAIGTNRINVQTNVRVGGVWGEHWNSKNYRILTQITETKFVITLYSRNNEAWNYFSKITIDKFSIPSKKDEKKQRKNKEFYRYNCKVEFYYSVEYPSIEECFADYGGFVVDASDKSAKKRIVDGTVALNPEFFTAGTDSSNDDMIINLHLDNVSMAIYLNNKLYFKLK